MPVLSTTYTSYTPSSLSRNSSGFTSLIRPYASSSSPLSSYSSKSRSSYDLINHHRTPSSYSTSSSSSSSSSSSVSSYKSPSSTHYSPSNSYYNNSRYSSISSSPSVTLTKYNPRRSSLDCNDDSSNGITSKATILYSGLTNTGNTCYMNSVLQALYATKSLRDYILSNADSGGSLYYALKKLFQEMGSARGNYVNPISFRSQFVSYQPKFRGNDQQDSQEFCLHLLNGIHDEVNKVKRRPKITPVEPKSGNEAWNYFKSAIDDSRLIDLFVGQFSSVIKCTECSNTSTCWDPFWDLSLPLPQNRITCDIEKCLKEFTAQEVLDYDEKPYCSRCKKPTRSTKRLTIQRAPPILILHLKKFANDGYKLSRQDIDVNERITIEGKNYNLLACVCHHGMSSRSGHYTAYCKYDSKWFHFNDERVSEVTRSFSTSELGDAYLLFYQQSNQFDYSSRL